ncbi:MAG: high-affinity nickel-transport family protein [Acidobacteria bacterium]|nr:high-affinity nickel-transport family protein [Acidobacteriota bacterium]
MIGLVSILAVGFFLGMRHATDPDHVIAVSTIVSRQPKLSRAALIGAFWGLGHTVTIFVVGTAIILFNVSIPPRIGLSMELSVGVMLILLGLFNVASFFRALPAAPLTGNLTATAHSHPHTHGDYVHSHQHGHQPETHPHSQEQTPLAFLDRLFGKSGMYQHLRPLAIGVVHGLAGSAAVALLVLATIRNANWAIAYLLVFGVGTIAGMMVITMSLAAAIKALGSRSQTISHRLAVASGALSLAFGCLVVYQIGFVNGLFTNHPLWTPR